jgi:hypothetical protein
MDDYRPGWEDPIAQLNSLRVAVECLRKVRMGPSRFDHATFPLIKYRYVPEHLKYRYENIRNARRAVRKDYSKRNTVFRFHLLSSRDRRALEDDIFALYEACLLDIGRMYEMGGIATLGYEIMYPKDAAPHTVKPRSDPNEYLPPQGVNSHVYPSRTGTLPREPQYVRDYDPETDG